MVKENVLGIDLGTTFSCMSIMKAGKSIVIPNAEGERRTASVVAFTKDGEQLIGSLAKRQAVTNPQRTIQSIKRMMGSKEKIKVDNKNYSSLEISALILKKLKIDAEEYIGEKISKAVITVPAYFNEVQRQATRKAGKIAGLEIIYILNNAVASALAYGLDNKQDTTILVYDLGGGTFDVSILTLTDGVLEAKSTAGNNHLGGDDFDEKLTDHLVKEFKKKEGIDLRKDPYALQRLRETSETAKIELSQRQLTNIKLPNITKDASGPKSLNIDLTRFKFEQLIEDLVELTVVSVKRVLSDAKLEPKDIDHVLLVGGSTRVPIVQNTVKKFFGENRIKTRNLDEYVALGAGIQGAVLNDETNEIVLLDVTSLTLGIETPGGIATKIIERNTTIPIRKSQIFSTAADGQPIFDIHVVQGERALAKDNDSLGRFQLTGIPPAPRGVPQIEVTFDINSNGIIHVSAKDLGSGNQEKFLITGDNNISEVKEDIAVVKKERENFADRDFYTIPEVAERLKVNEELVRGLIRCGELHAYRIGEEIRIENDDIDEYLQSCNIRQENIEEE
jgi:molecular chaperone DnaK